MRWFISDTHFQHTNIIEYCNRPFKDTYHMDLEISRRWNEVVSNDDEVYFVGDVIMGFFETGKKIVQGLKGKKILIMGNHDRSKKSMLECGFDQVYSSLSLDMNDGRKALLRHKPIPHSLIKPHDLQIHGHHHKGPIVRGKRVNVCVDLWDYRPIPENEILGLQLGDESEDIVEVEASGGRVRVTMDIDSKDLDGASDEIIRIAINSLKEEK